jgi:hypothetical protein
MGSIWRAFKKFENNYTIVNVNVFFEHLNYDIYQFFTNTHELTPEEKNIYLIIILHNESEINTSDTDTPVLIDYIDAYFGVFMNDLTEVGKYIDRRKINTFEYIKGIFRDCNDIISEYIHSWLQYNQHISVESIRCKSLFLERDNIVNELMNSSNMKKYIYNNICKNTKLRERNPLPFEDIYRTSTMLLYTIRYVFL